jgi:hypothetical protein
MCQSCFVSQGARHCHGQAAFSCPELDELEQDDEGDEGDEGDFDMFNEYLASLAAQGGAEGDDQEDATLDELAFRYADESDLVHPESVRLADENGPLERITSEQASKLEAEEDTPIKLLFPKTAASVIVAAAKPKVSHKKKQPTPSVAHKSNQDLDKKMASVPVPSKKAKKKRAPTSSTQPKQPLQQLSSVPFKAKGAKNGSESGVLTNQQKPKKRKKAAKATQSLPTGVDEDVSLRVMLQNFSAVAPTVSPKKVQKESPKKVNSTSPSKLQEVKTTPVYSIGSQPAAPATKKRARAEGSVPKVKKQKLISIPKTGGSEIFLLQNE